jgi:hypothetical protein
MVSESMATPFGKTRPAGRSFLYSLMVGLTGIHPATTGKATGFLLLTASKGYRKVVSPACT